MALHLVDPADPGIARRRCGRGFSYSSPQGRTIKDRRVLARIRALAVPPAWEDVWICPDPDGHIQAVGVDDRGRRQYRYHPDWVEERSAEKHERVLRFARRLPELRERVRGDLALDGMPRDRVLACAMRLLELGAFRIGGEAYAEENSSYGLATIQRRHVRVRGGAVEFDYEAKGGQPRRVRVHDPAVREVVVGLRRRRAAADDELLAYRDEGGAWVDVRSDDINAYVREVLGEEFSAKDFRTWVGTVYAAVLLAESADDGSTAGRRKLVVEAVKQVAELLGNTPAVARSAYIDPRVIEAFEADDTADEALEADALHELEESVIDLLERAPTSRRRRRTTGAR
ncbi:MAG: DNA topoisomerase IB [Acidimicrobiales bacterium]